MARTSDPELAERRRRQIIDAALLCFRRRGFHQASMQEICAEAQISAGALYRYFPSKNRLIAAIAEDVQLKVDSILTVVEAGGDVEAAFEALAATMFDEIFVYGDGSLVAEVMAEASRDADLSQRLVDIQAGTHGRMCRVLQAAADAGRIHLSVTPEIAASLLVAAIDGLGLSKAMNPAISTDDVLPVFRALLRQTFASAKGLPAATARTTRTTRKQPTDAPPEESVS